MPLLWAIHLTTSKNVSRNFRSLSAARAIRRTACICCFDTDHTLSDSLLDRMTHRSLSSTSKISRSATLECNLSQRSVNGPHALELAGSLATLMSITHCSLAMLLTTLMFSSHFPGSSYQQHAAATHSHKHSVHVRIAQRLANRFVCPKKWLDSGDGFDVGVQWAYPLCHRIALVVVAVV